MSPENRNNYDPDQLNLTEPLAEQLRRSFRTERPVPPEVDRAIIEGANAHFNRRFGRRLRIRRWIAAGSAAAAILICLAIFLPSLHKAPRRLETALKDKGGQGASSARAFMPADIDRSGRVDILDAFKLARYIEAGGADNKSWDFNTDGRIDRADVDSLAQTAVMLNRGVKS